ncbi:MAG TPA: hypothetical protein VFC41_09565 [Anaerovoracaceae bacterium]|nr:hypothetical protein [Anaerovoracaceae bacterium]
MIVIKNEAISNPPVHCTKFTGNKFCAVSRGPDYGLWRIEEKKSGKSGNMTKHNNKYFVSMPANDSMVENRKKM